MTRDEKILIEAAQHSDYVGAVCSLPEQTIKFVKGAFIYGVMWADENPANAWHNVSKEPDEYSNIVIVDNNKRFLEINYCSTEYDCYGLLGWGACQLHYDIRYWAYVDDLLPKGGDV